MKKNVMAYVASFMMIAVWMGLSLSCGGSAPEEPKTKVTLEDVNKYVAGQDVNILVNNGLTSDQLMEVTKLCISTGELNNVTIIEENQKLSYAVLDAKISTRKIPLTVRFSYSISKSGTLKMRLTQITETDPKNAPCEFTVYTKDFEATMDSVKTSILDSVKSIGNAVLERSADFA